MRSAPRVVFALTLSALMVAALASPSNAQDPTPAPGGTILYLRTKWYTRSSVRAIRTDGTERIVLVRGKDLPGRDPYITSASLEPGGERLALGVITGNRAFHWRIRVEIFNLRTRVVEAAWPGGSPKWSPDGSAIAFKETSCGLVLLARPDGSEIHPIIDTASCVWAWAWSPDSTRIAYSSGSLHQELRIVDVDTGADVVIQAENVPPCCSVAWSPDGAKLVYTSWIDVPDPDLECQPDPELVMRFISPTGTDASTIPGSWRNGLVWSPDGTWLAGGWGHVIHTASCGSEFRYDVVIGSADGTTSVRLTSDPAIDSVIAWLA